MVEEVLYDRAEIQANKKAKDEADKKRAESRLARGLPADDGVFSSTQYTGDIASQKGVRFGGQGLDIKKNNKKKAGDEVFSDPGSVLSGGLNPIN